MSQRKLACRPVTKYGDSFRNALTSTCKSYGLTSLLDEPGTDFVRRGFEITYANVGGEVDITFLVVVRSLSKTDTIPDYIPTSGNGRVVWPAETTTIHMTGTNDIAFKTENEFEAITGHTGVLNLTEEALDAGIATTLSAGHR